MELPVRKPRALDALIRGFHDLITRAVPNGRDYEYLRRSRNRQNIVGTPFLPSFMNNLEDIQDELDQSETLWREYRERRFELRMQQAKLGINAEPAVTIEIRRIKTQMDELSNRYIVLSEVLQKMTEGRHRKRAIGQTDNLDTTPWG
jgi:hypothetical protein